MIFRRGAGTFNGLQCRRSAPSPSGFGLGGRAATYTAAMFADVETQKAIKTAGTLSIIMGALTAIVGVLLLLNLWEAAQTIAVLVSLGLIVAGISDIVDASGSEKPIWGFIFGGGSIVIGFISLLIPSITLASLAVVVGIGFIVVGIVRIGAAWSNRKAPDAPWVGIAGDATLVAGIVCVAWPKITVLAISILFGIRLLAGGILDISAGIAATNLAKE
jgi:uncharacterized membrane protein HdeD (DUF308 family)